MKHPPRRGGPVPYCRLNSVQAVQQGLAVVREITAGRSIRQAADAVGLAPTTAWRRYWLVMDWTRSAMRGPRPPLRGTAAWDRERVRW
ncbi:hypothetical protein F8568_036790 [Actinomadura sp. LD22]|uniref:Uncharacterized protein n=1 Tax=Actinomadura physcomitrii TaxID=2650748 RepID=A0A6I4MLK1_9ACTN|nr:hypothetical protein [Actinomadura physcomitrii]MWA05820.1 hypothetical protein [Actinomadura physcomitrii]